MPAGGDDFPQSEDGLGPSPPVALTVSSSDEEDEEAIAADPGYQPLPTCEADDDDAGESDTEAGNATEASMSSTEALCGSAATDIVLHSSHLPVASVAANIDVKERAELWSKVHCSRVDSLPMDTAHADTIRSVMSNISLPQSCFPAWANIIPEGEWKAKLVSQISGSVDVSGDNIVSKHADDSSIISTDNSCRQDMQDA